MSDSLALYGGPYHFFPAPDFLIDELPARIARGAVTFHLKAQLASPGDSTKDASTPWPNRDEVVELGVLTIDKAVLDSLEAQKKLLFLPGQLTDGIGFLAEFGQENSVEVSVLNVRVMSKSLGQRRLAVTAGATQRGGDGDSIALGVEQLPFQCVEFLGAFDEIGWRLGRHHGDALLPALVRQDADQRRLVFRQTEVVNLTEPARQLAEVSKTRPLDRADRLALLASQPNLAPDDGLSSAAGVTTRTKCCSALDFNASSIWFHQSRKPSSVTMSCQTERCYLSRLLWRLSANSAPSLRE
jgi:hypothetical protein